MPYTTKETGSSLTLIGEGEHDGTTATVPLRDVENKTAEDRENYLNYIFANTHALFLRTKAGLGWRSAL